jgi:hypothetical protein
MKTNNSSRNKSQNKGKTIFGKEDKKSIDKLALFSGFIERSKSKITASNLILGFMQMVSKGLKTYEDWASETAMLCGKSLSKQAIEERMNFKTETMLRLFFEEKLSSVLHNSTVEKTMDRGQKFKSIKIDDSTVINLPVTVNEVFPGNVSRGEKKSQAKIHALYNLTNNTFPFLNLHSFRENDQSLSDSVLPYLEAGDLILRDLGFQVLSVQKQFIEKGIYFISKKKFGTKIFDVTTGKEIKLLNHLRKKGWFDKEVLVGKTDQIKMRLVIIPFSEEKAGQRRRKAKKDRDKRCNHSLEYYELLGYSVLITNVSSDKCSRTEIGQIYGLRWRIETIFKSWKTYLSLEKIIPMKCKNIHRIKCSIYLMLLYIVLFQMVWMNCCIKDRKRNFQGMSLLKLAKFFIQHLTAIFDPKRSGKLEKQLLKQCKYEKRNDRENTMEKYEKLAA